MQNKHKNNRTNITKKSSVADILRKIKNKNVDIKFSAHDTFLV